MLRPACAALVALSLAACTANSPEHAELDIPTIEMGDVSLDTLKEVTRTLSSDEFGGRFPGTEGETKTLAYIVEQFERAGLEPGNDGSWFQDVPLVDITASNFAPLTVKGGSQPLTFAEGEDFVGVTYREDAHTDLKDSELVFVGYGVNAPEKGWNDYAGIDMAGKTAVILVNDPDWQTEGLDGTFNGKAMTYYGRWTYKYEEAARQGAAGAIIVHQTDPASYGWNVVESSWSGPQSYAQRSNGGSDQTQFNGWIQKSAAEKIFGAAGKDFAELEQAASQPGFKPVPLGETVSTSFDNAIRKYSSKNVVGLLRGSQRPDEYVLHSAHWDHLGDCTPDAEGDSICNGAVDNATGVAALVALAQAHAQAGPPARSLVFLAVTAEESGLLGSEYYGAHPVFPLSQTVGGLNMDALEPYGEARDVTVIGEGKSELDKFLAPALKEEGLVATPDASPQAGYYYRSDHFSFAKRGVPMFYVDIGQDLVDGGKEAGAAKAAEYRADAYHGPNDEYREDWDWAGVEKTVDLFYRLGRMMAQSKSWPIWVEGDEFRAIRDESCAGEGGC